MTDLLPLLTVSSTEDHDIVLNSIAAKNSILEFNKLLNVYRKHEAKHQLLELLSAKVESAKELETKLQQ